MVKIIFPVAVFFASACCLAGVQTYEVEDLNDPDIVIYPNPVPVNLVTKSFIAGSGNYTDTIYIASTNVHNQSVTLENLGDSLVRNPYLFGPQGYDFRTVSALAPTIVEGVSTEEEKFFRIHEWLGYHYTRSEFGNGLSEYKGSNNSRNAGRLINQFGGSMCGEAVEALSGLLYQVPPVGSIYARKVQLSGHQTGEVYLNESWHAFDASMDTRWVFYQPDNTTLGPTYRDMKNDAGLMPQNIRPWINDNMRKRVVEGSCETSSTIKVQGDVLHFGYDLRPSESIRMDFDMQGKTDRKRVDPNATWFGGDKRNPVDYGSATFTYNPDFTNTVHEPYAVAEHNVKWTPSGLEPKSTGRPAWIVYPAKSTWSFVGSKIMANFKTSGKVFIGRNSDVEDTDYSSSGVTWSELSADTKEYGAGTIEGLMAYWVKFEFEGAGSGLLNAEIASEVMMNPLSMPALQHGSNSLAFVADDMGASSVKVTYEYDDQAQFDYYEVATEDYGRHIRYRVGGNQMLPWDKLKFFERINTTPTASVPVKVEVFSVSGPNAGEKVRTLKSGNMKYGMYWWYWDGRDDSGQKCPRGMYSYLITEDGVAWGTNLYLYDKMWPVPNEVRAGIPAAPSP